MDGIHSWLRSDNSKSQKTTKSGLVVLIAVWLQCSLGTWPICDLMFSLLWKMRPVPLLFIQISFSPGCDTNQLVWLWEEGRKAAAREKQHEERVHLTRGIKGLFRPNQVHLCRDRFHYVRHGCQRKWDSLSKEPVKLVGTSWDHSAVSLCCQCYTLLFFHKHARTHATQTQWDQCTTHKHPFLLWVF